MKPARTFQDLLVWQKAHALVLSVYRLSSSFPSHERYELASQMRTAAVSVPANIAEGFKKQSRAEKAHFMNIAQGSIEELRYYLILTKGLAYGDSESLMRMLEETSRLLEAYVQGTATTTHS